MRIHRWPLGWSLVGNGPSYLLFDARKKEVTHLAGGLHRALRQDLKGYSVLDECGELAAMVRMLTLASADAIYEVDPRPDAAKRKEAAYIVIRAIEKLIYQDPFDERLFSGRLRRLCTLLRASRRLAAAQGSPPGVPQNVAAPRACFFARDRSGQRLFFTPWARFRIEPSSKIARCAALLWCEDQTLLGDQEATVLYRIPTRKELRLHLGSDEASVTKLCRREGFDWLPAAGRNGSR